LEGGNCLLVSNSARDLNDVDWVSSNDQSNVNYIIQTSRDEYPYFDNIYPG